MPPVISIYINECSITFVSPVTLGEARNTHKPDADLLIVNGAVTDESCLLADGDRIVLIKKGQIPTREELRILMTARHSPGVHEKVSGATVGIAGLGGLGSSVAVALARTGVGTLVLVDFDVVEPSNLNRQQFYTSQIGQLKTEALAENLEKINPYISIVPHPVKVDETTIAALFNSCDVVAEAFDGAESKSMILNHLPDQLPDCYLVMASGLAGCDTGNTIQTHRLTERIYVAGDLVTAAVPGTGLMAPRVGIAAHHQANMIVRILLGELEP